MLPIEQSIPKNTGTAPLFSIIVPTWNNLPYLQLLIKSLRKNATYPHQIIVAINEGKDGTLEWVKSQDDLDWAFFEQNVGICYALNACRALVRTDFLVYFNDDMYACPGWDQVFLTEINAIGHRKFFLSSTMIEPMDTGNPCVIVQDFGRDIEHFEEEKLLSTLPMLHKNDWAGATWPPNIVPIELWDLVGGYSVEFSPGMYSDPDFSMKLWAAGVRYFKGMGASRVYHFGSKSTRKLGRSRGSDLFLRKWGLTAGTFSRFMLRKGSIWTGALAEVELGFWVKLKNRLKFFITKDVRYAEKH